MQFNYWKLAAKAQQEAAKPRPTWFQRNPLIGTCVLVGIATILSWLAG
jgi:hypothetical protein